ncbi:uncharacterized protein LOC127847793 isoform X4 [Dreissena polymorpha]|uniref:uncharacterized protein LOC127847793 isoform X4 n=1 Tax=Dreissena polymorpha TaxID=45954 RepID=UPI002264D304|nr:uncharacterized protein LOC127847793 isoform X4 [Dreissena polymorpha]
MATIKETDVHLQKCRHHGNENQIFYCSNHDDTICGRCLHAKHRQCESVDLFTVNVDESRKSETMTMLTAFEKEIEGYAITVKKDIELNDQCKSKAMHDVESFCTKMMTRLSDLKKDAERECTKKHEQNSDHLGQLVKKCNEEKLMVGQYKQLVEVLVQKKYNRHLYIEVCRIDRKKNEISARINSLITKRKRVEFSFRPNYKLAKLMCSQMNDIGKIEEQVNGSDEVSEDIVQNNTSEANTQQMYARDGLGHETGGPSRTYNTNMKEAYDEQNMSSDFNRKYKEESPDVRHYAKNHQSFQDDGTQNSAPHGNDGNYNGTKGSLKKEEPGKTQCDDKKDQRVKNVHTWEKGEKLNPHTVGGPPITNINNNSKAYEEPIMSSDFNRDNNEKLPYNSYLSRESYGHTKVDASQNVKEYAHGNDAHNQRHGRKKETSKKAQSEERGAQHGQRVKDVQN